MRNAQTDHGRKLEQTVWNSYFAKDERTHESTATLNETGKEFLRQLARSQSFPDPQIWLQYPSDVTDTSKHDQIIAERRIAIRNFLSKETHLGGDYKYQIAVLDPAERTDAAAWAATAKKGIDIGGKRTGDQRDAGSASGGGVRPKAIFQQIEGASGGSGGASQSKFTIERREDPSRGSGGGIQGKLTIEQRAVASAGSGGGIQDKFTVKRDDTSAGSGGGIQDKLSSEQSEDASAGSGGSSGGAGGVVVRNSIRTIAADSLGACDRRTIVR
jgi:hypothetical protein